MTFVVALLGARMNYAVPRILHEAGRLERLFTDSCATLGWPRCLRLIPAGWRPAAVRRLLGRRPEGIPAARITAFQRLGLHYARRRAAARTPSDATGTYLWQNQTFCEQVCRQDWGQAGGVFTFNGAGLEVLRLARARGLRTVIEQTIAPRAVEERLLREERESFPAWEAQAADPFLDNYAAREQAEWSLADQILCGSEFVRQGVRDCGGPVERCAVVPYGVDVATPAGQRRPRGGPLRVLTVGAVGLRKGSPYVLRAAQALKGRACFRMVGPLALLPRALDELRAHVEVTGPVPRDALAGHYAWADVFLLPSICEGSATVTYDALAHGLPVMATPNTGSVVRDGREGYVVALRDAEALVVRLEALAADADLLLELSRRAFQRAREFSLRAYGDRLLGALTAGTGANGRGAELLS
jgi:glycosyltransferase involved in cell wall biosynthesis